MWRLKLTQGFKIACYITLPIHRALSSEIENPLQRIAQYAAGQIARNLKDNLMLRDRAILILIDINTAIGCPNDPANKLALIANVSMDTNLVPEDVNRTGITGVTTEQVRQAATEGKFMRLVGRVEKDPLGKVIASVAPEPLPASHPLAGVDGSEKGITYTTDTMDRVTVAGGKSDPKGTAAALLKDLLNIYRPL